MNTNEELTINLCVPALRVADVPYNSAEAIKLINKLSGESQGFQLILFPQLSLSAYTCGDLFRLPLLARACLEALENIEAAVADRDCLVVLGLPLQIGDGLYDAAALVGGTGLQGFVLNQSPELPFFTSPVDIERDVLGWRERTVPILRDGYSFGRWAGKNISVQLGRLDADFQISKTEILLNPCALPALADIDYEVTRDISTHFKPAKGLPGSLLSRTRRIDWSICLLRAFPDLASGKQALRRATAPFREPGAKPCDYA